jgi:Asp-tRNA(Asn)/Glu-tRNA(Gln) amidotransferase C subunit
MREDVVAPSWAPAAVLANAPRREDDLFEVQAIFD